MKTTVKIVLNLIFSFAIYNAGAIYLYTPNGSDVYAFTNAEMSASDIVYYTNLYQTAYPQAQVLANASSTYNCHSYAWNMSEGGQTCWLNQSPDLHKYWDDGSYLLTTESATEKIFYYNGDHSAVKSNTHSGKYESKWGSMPLMRHSPNYGPSSYDMSYRRYYAKNIWGLSISGPTSMCRGYSSNGGSGYDGGTYTIANKPANATVTWSCSDILYKTGANGTTSNSATFFSTSSGTAWIKAVININGTNYTLPVFNISVYGTDGTYFQSTFTGGDSWLPLRTPDWPVVPIHGSGTVVAILNSIPGATFTWTFYPYSLTPSYWAQFDGDNSRLNFYPVPGSGSYFFFVTMQSAGCNVTTEFEFKETDGSSSSQYSYSYTQQSSILAINFGNKQAATTEGLTNKTATNSYTVRLFDFNGALVMQGNSAGESISFNLSGKPNGIYIVCIYDVSSNKLVKTMKFLKEY